MAEPAGIRRTIKTFGADILASEGMESEKEFIQHGGITCYAHSMSVAETSVWLARRIKGVDMRSLVRGALLHDYFLYDWHVPAPDHKLHAFRHPGTALARARRDFRLNSAERDVIARHMFPLTPIPPRCREAWIVCLADKLCALDETVTPRVRKLFGGRGA